MATRLIAVATLACLVLAALHEGRPMAAQGPGATPPATATATPQGTPVLPPPVIAGDWSITRTWYRRCPGCAFTVTRTTSWRIEQFGVQVTVDKGLRGVIVGAPDGTGLLTLEGIESSGPEVYRFWYNTLRVRADGGAFEGGFNGSESIINPCGEDPPLVTCTASNGYLTARRIAPVATATPPGPPVPTGLPTPFPLPSGTATSPASATPTASATATPRPPTPTPTASPTATPRPIYRLYLPDLECPVGPPATETATPPPTP